MVDFLDQGANDANVQAEQALAPAVEDVLVLTMLTLIVQNGSFGVHSQLKKNKLTEKQSAVCDIQVNLRYLPGIYRIHHVKIR